MAGEPAVVALGLAAGEPLGEPEGDALAAGVTDGGAYVQPDSPAGDPHAVTATNAIVNATTRTKRVGMGTEVGDDTNVRMPDRPVLMHTF